MATIHFVDENADAPIPDGSPLKPVCKEHGIVYGCEEGNCGTCMCTIVEGKENLEPPNDKEKEFFGEEELDRRLTCQARIRSGRISLYQ